MHSRLLLPAAALTLVTLAACATPDADPLTKVTERAAGEPVLVVDTLVRGTLDAAGVAQPLLQATLSTRLMGTVTEVLVREGDQVAAGQPLVRIDARDLAAKSAPVAAGVAEAEAVHREAQTQTARIRSLYADSAATRAQLDAAETGLARAEAAVRQAQAAAAELRAVSGYAVVTAPFAGVVTRRFVDPGAFAAPGAPLLSIQDGSRLRITAAVSPGAVRGLRRGVRVEALVESARVVAVIEGIVPAAAGNVYTVNAIADNRDGALLPGSAASLLLPQGTRRALLVPEGAVQRQGDLTGVLVRGTAGDELRWVRVAPRADGTIEVLGGLRGGETVIVPAAPRPVASIHSTNGGR